VQGINCGLRHRLRDPGACHKAWSLAARRCSTAMSFSRVAARAAGPSLVRRGGMSEVEHSNCARHGGHGQRNKRGSQRIR
jgi:hypothetical protein